MSYASDAERSHRGDEAGSQDAPRLPSMHALQMRALARRAQARDIVQALGGEAAGGDVHALAARGVSGAGGALPHREKIQASFGRFDVGGIAAHVGGASRDAAEGMGASAYATGEDVAFAEAPDLHTAAHEAAHVVQQRGGVQLAGGVGRAGDPYEQHADAVADAVVRGESAEALLAEMAGPESEGAAPASAKVQMNPAKGVTKRLWRWISRETVQKQISKHVAKHGRSVAGKAVHSIFKRPNTIRSMVRKTAAEAMALAQKSASKSADDVLKGPGIRMFRQSAGKGKFRWVIEREFKNPIGKAGEKVLKIVVDYSGRIVTAYPTKALSSMGLGVAAMGVFDGKAAEAGERIQDAVEADQRRREADANSWGSFAIDVLTPIGLTPSVANDGEGLWLTRRNIVRHVFAKLVSEIEQAESRKLSEEERRKLYELLTVSVGSAMIAQGGGEDDE